MQAQSFRSPDPRLRALESEGRFGGFGLQDCSWVLWFRFSFGFRFFFGGFRVSGFFGGLGFSCSLVAVRHTGWHLPTGFSPRIPDPDLVQLLCT